MRAMKDSGVEWLGEVPAGWGITPTKHLFFISKTIAGKTGYDVLSVTQHGLKVKDTKSGEGQIAADYSHYQLVEPGDFAMNHMDLLTGWIDIAKQGGVTSPDYRVFKSRTKHMDKRFFLRVFQYYYSGRIFYGFCKGISNRGRWRLPADAFGSICLPVPPLDEQRRIADFLDEKCAQIDRAITSAEQSIQGYKAYQEATIVEQFRAATAKRVKLPHFADSVLGKMLDQSQQRGVNVHLYLANRDVQWFNLNFDNLAEMDFPEDSYGRYGIEDGDILVCEGGEVGRCAVFRGETPGIYFQKAVHRIRVNQEFAYPEFIVYQMFAKAKTGNFMEVRKGQATFNHLPGEQLKQLRFALPPLDEQRRIANFLDEKCAQVDRAVKAKQAIIDELKLYKKSLIYEVVTGKREV